MDWFARHGWRKGAFHRKFFIGLGDDPHCGHHRIHCACGHYDHHRQRRSLVLCDPLWTICTDVAPRQAGALSGIMNFFGICGATISPYVSGAIAQATGAFVAPLELAVAIMLVAATTLSGRRPRRAPRRPFPLWRRNRRSRRRPQPAVGCLGSAFGHRAIMAPPTSPRAPMTGTLPLKNIERKPCSVSTKSKGNFRSSLSSYGGPKTRQSSSSSWRSGERDHLHRKDD
jgi:hypothetical protein